MPIHYIEGDLLENEHNARAFAIESNTEGLMNTQVAVQFRTRYPRLYESYRHYCQEPAQFNPGDVFVWEDNTGQVVYNLAIYADPYLTLASHDAIKQTLSELRRLVEENRIDSIAMPPIAAGMGGLNWRGAKRALEETFDGFEGDIYVYMKSKAPERDLDAIQSQIDDSSSGSNDRRSDDGNKNNNRRSRRGRRRRSGRGRRSNKNNDSSGNQAASSSDDGKSDSNNSNEGSKKNDQQKSDGTSSNRSRRGRRGRGRRGGRNRNRQNKGDNKQNNNSGNNQNN